ncbi:MAG: hypothetical protein ACQEP1_00305 [Nanobdellota archaeon]
MVGDSVSGQQEQQNQQTQGGNGAQQKQSGSKTITFGAPKKPKGPSPEVKKLTSEVGEVGRKVRILEERYSNIRRKSQLTEHNMLTIQKNLNKEVKQVNNEIKEVQKTAKELKEKMDQILREINNFASSDEVKALDAYVNFWNPVEFMTRKEAEKLVRDIIEENRKI